MLRLWPFESSFFSCFNTALQDALYLGIAGLFSSVGKLGVGVRSFVVCFGLSGLININFNFVKLKLKLKN